jgi:thioredoxin 1
VNAEENLEARKAAGVDNLPYFAVFKNGKLVNGAATSLEPKVVELLESL